MRIVVPIKQVPETKNVKMDEKTGTVIREGVQSIVNPLDLYSIELALQLKEIHDCEVIAVTMGPQKARLALKEAISMGVDSGILLSDRAFGGSDTWATGYVLAEAIKKIGAYDLVICGERATDGDTGQVGPGIAAFLDIPVLSYVSRMKEISDSCCTVERMVEEGHEVLSCSLPVVLTVVKEIGDPRLPTLRGKQRAKRSDIPAWDHKTLNIEPDSVGLKGSPTRVVKIFKPQVTRQCQMFQATDEIAIQRSVETVFDQLGKKEVL